MFAFAVLVETSRSSLAAHLLLKEVLSVAEGAKLGLLLFVLQLLLRRPEVEDEILEGENDALQRKWHRARRLVLPTQRVQTPAGKQPQSANRIISDYNSTGNEHEKVNPGLVVLDELPEESHGAVDHSSRLGLLRLGTRDSERIVHVAFLVQNDLVNIESEWMKGWINELHY